jgi:hypothetical protein
MTSRWPNLALISFVLLGVMLCLYIVATRELSASESLLLSLVLSILSLLGSWVASRYYSEISFNNNLRVFALKAAEKVNNLSNELDRLSVYLQHELEAADYETVKEELLAKDLRIEGAIHIINTLKSVNDRSLSDWQGVIGEELDAQREEREEREEDLRELVDRVEALSIQLGNTAHERNSITAALKSEVESIKSDLRLVTTQIGGIPIRRTTKPPRENLDAKCPHCSNNLKYRQRPKANSFKVIKCEACGVKLLSTYKDDGFILSEVTTIKEEVTCPHCGEHTSAELGSVPGNATTIECNSCSSQIRLTRSPRRLVVKLVDNNSRSPSSIVVDEEILELVRAAMPTQPWPTGARRKAAEELGLPVNVVGKAIDQLMIRGVFKAQVDGQLFVPEREGEISK